MVAGPRKDVYDPTKSGCYHCFTHTMNDVWFTDEEQRQLMMRVELLAGIFSIDVANFAIMSNHYHLLLRSRPELIKDWSDAEVIRRYSRLNSKRLVLKDELDSEAIEALLSEKQKLELYRVRLGDISWFMRMLNESVACEFNVRHNRKNPVWSSRFKMQALLEDKAILACAVYIDLNHIRAGITKTINESRCNSIYLRIHDIVKYLRHLRSLDGNAQAELDEEASTFCEGDIANLSNQSPRERPLSGWLLPVHQAGDGSTASNRRASDTGLLNMTEGEYISLVEASAQIPHPDKPCYQDPKLPPLAERLGFTAEAWNEVLAGKLSQIGRVLGPVAAVRRFSQTRGKDLTGRIRQIERIFG